MSSEDGPHQRLLKLKIEKMSKRIEGTPGQIEYAQRRREHWEEISSLKSYVKDSIGGSAGFLTHKDYEFLLGYKSNNSNEEFLSKAREIAGKRMEAKAIGFVEESMDYETLKENSKSKYIPKNLD